MSKPFDMELFLAGMLTGSHATRQRHLRQAMLIQAEIANLWQLETPWAWQRKHVTWFLEHCLDRRCDATRYYYFLTMRLIVRRLEKPWTLPPREKKELTYSHYRLETIEFDPPLQQVIRD